MDDTTDKSVAPADSTAGDQSGEALNDKDLGQATEDTGESQNGSDARDDAPQDESDTEEGTDETATSEDDGNEEGEQAEDSLLTPEEVAKLPKELKASYVAMNTRFQERMGQVKTLVEEARAVLDARGKAGDPGATEAAERPILIDRTKLAQAKSQDDVIALIEEAIFKGGEMAAEKKVQPIYGEKAAAEVDTYFKAHPERSKYRKAMGEKDAVTREKLSLDELYYAVAGKDLEAAGMERKDKKMRDLNKGNAESQSGTTGKSGAEGDVFDEIAKAGGHGDSILL